MRKRTSLIVVVALLGLTAFAGGLMISSWATTVDASATKAKTSQSASQAEAIVAEDQATLAEDDMAQAMTFAETEVASALPGVAAAPFGPAGDSPDVQGVITKVENNGAKLTINGRRVVNLNDQTVVGDANGTLKKEDLKQDDRVVALGKVETDKSLTARWVLRQPALPTVVGGAVSSIDTATNTFKIKVGRDNTEWTVSAASAKFTKDGKDAKFSDLATGDRVNVVGKADKTAKKIEATSVNWGRPALPNRDNVVRGKIKSLGTNSFVVTEKVGTTETDRTVTVDANTKYFGKGVTSFADLKVGDEVGAIGDKQADGSLKATNVGKGGLPNRMPKMPGRPGGMGNDQGFGFGGPPGFPGRPGGPPPQGDNQSNG